MKSEFVNQGKYRVILHNGPDTHEISLFMNVFGDWNIFEEIKCADGQWRTIQYIHNSSF